MSILSKLIIAATLTVATATAASAACNVNYRQFHQNGRIIHGAYTGNLSYREFRHLERNEAAIRQMERVARADGHITPGECLVLNQALNFQSNRIWLKKHN